MTSLERDDLCSALEALADSTGGRYAARAIATSIASHGACVDIDGSNAANAFLCEQEAECTPNHRAGSLTFRGEYEGKSWCVCLKDMNDDGCEP